MTAGLITIEFVGLLFAGVLAGEEFIVRYGVQPALTSLADDRAHIQARQALVRKLRVVVPSIMVPTVLLGIAVVIVGGAGAGVAFRWAGLIALVAFVLLSFLGTVPINIQVNDWQVDAPPDEWKSLVRRWERIDIYRSSAALVAFACFLIAVALQLAA